MKQTNLINSETHSRLAGLRSRLDSIIDSAEKARAFLDDPKKWRIAASHIDDIEMESGTATKQISELL